MKRVNLAIVGATGMVGRTFLKVLEERKFPINNLYLFSSEKSAGTELTFRGKEYKVEALTEESFDRDIDIALFSAGGDVSKKFAPIARDHGVIVVDNSSAWRMENDVPLVVPEVNPKDVDWNNGIIANPNCSTIQSVVPLTKLHEALTATTVRVPVKYGHCVSINLEFENPFEMDQIYKLLQKTEGVNIVDDVKNNVYPMPIDVEGKDEVYVGRIRRDYSVENGINMWVVADNIRKGAATNTVQIAELLVKKLK